VPTILTHAAVGAVAVRLFLPERATPRLYACAAALSMLPDADTLPMLLGDRGAWFGFHRGPSHSLLFAAAAGLAATLLLFPAERARIRESGWRLWLFLAAVTASHGLLDTFTDGGSGIELLWPFADGRWFAPWTPIHVSPIGVRGIFSERGLLVLASEALFVWLPLLVVLATTDHLRGRRGEGSPSKS
jgi:inner membrane protein